MRNRLGCERSATQMDLVSWWQFAGDRTDDRTSFDRTKAATIGAFFWIITDQECGVIGDGLDPLDQPAFTDEGVCEDDHITDPHLTMGGDQDLITIDQDWVHAVALYVKATTPMHQPSHTFASPSQSHRRCFRDRNDLS